NCRELQVGAITIRTRGRRQRPCLHNYIQGHRCVRQQLDCYGKSDRACEPGKWTGDRRWSTVHRARYLSVSKTPRGGVASTSIAASASLAREARASCP